MNPKTLLRVGLLGLVVISFAAFGYNEWRDARLSKEGQPGSVVAVASSDQETVSETVAEDGNRVVAYYFHGNMRCATCRKIEALTKEAIEAAFAPELELGTLQWREVNVDEAGNEHFIQDYQLTTRSVVISEIADGEEKRWKNLERVWQLVGNKGAFLDYIQEETRAYLEDGEA